ncbi:oxygenase (secreted protein) [Cystobacter fuscus]|uniref:Oxygenase (Secreted protein) n=1 Tax=Cystobacter fuscus TaxID=43 RepID=A0A250J2K8_9BACT|nr:TauD/TfdA family dioxygenase [Cystobacter fuscus]ATB37738.1 oxygenase (secreted protein) [Cystobacter fuscus]
MKPLALEDTLSKNIGAKLQAITSPYEKFEDSLVQVYKIFAELPANVIKDIMSFGRFPESPGVMLLENMPLDPVLPPTPKDGKPVTARNSFVGEGILLGLTQMLGEPVGFTSEKSGNLIHYVTPVESGSYTQSNQGSKVFLNYHNDSVHDESGYYHRFNPDYLILHCIRADKEGKAYTYYADARDICKALPAETVALLRQPLFRMAAPSTFSRERANGAQVWSNLVPIISGPDAFPEISIAANGVKGETPEAEKALEQLHAACHDDKVHTKVALRPGMTMLINNRKGLHARGVFEPGFDGEDRWLLRTYIRRNMWEMRHRSIGTQRVFA